MNETQYPITVVDQMGEKCDLISKPKRIVSLVPSQSELLLDLGLNEEVVGITKFCIEPKLKVKNIKKIGGTKKFDFDAIHALKPDLIIGNKEENYEEGINQLKQDYPVWMSDIFTLDDSLSMIKQLGIVVDAVSRSNQIANDITNTFEDLVVSQNKQSIKTVAYFIWRKPYMVAGNNTFIDEMIKLCGLQNSYSGLNRYPEIDIESLQEKKPDVIMLSSEPYPFKQKHIDELQVLLPESQFMLVDGMYFSWYGSRLLGTGDYLRSLQKEIN